MLATETLRLVLFADIPCFSHETYHWRTWAASQPEALVVKYLSNEWM